MRSKKLLKRLSIILGILGLVILVCWSYLFFNPFEGSVAELRDCVPRGVDFFVNKVDLRSDFRGQADSFPYVPKFEELERTEHWSDLAQDEMVADVASSLRELRKVFVDSQVGVGIDTINLFDELLAREVQVAGRFGPAGFDDMRWCAYLRISSWVKAAYGWIMQRGFSRDAFPGVTIVDDGEYYKITARGETYYCVRHLDCLMLANDRSLLAESYELALGNTQESEPLGPSSNYREGVERPLRVWMERVGLTERPSVLEFYLRPGKLIPTMPALRNWGKNIDEDNKNEKILASFVNLESFRFLSGTAIFEPNSLSLLTHLVVNANKLSTFQKELFTDKVQQRKKWMDQFFNMVPTDACGAAALRLPAGDFIAEIAEDYLSREERQEINDQIKRTGKFADLNALIKTLDTSLQPRVGVILRPNIRSAESVKLFKVHSESPFPQWAWVFWIKKDYKGRMQSKALNELIKMFGEHRATFNIKNAWTLDLSGSGGRSDAAFEFAIPQIPGTGSLAVCTYGDYFIFGNSGPFILRMVRALNGKDTSIVQEKEYDYKELESDMSPAVNAVAFAWARNLRTVGKHFKDFNEKLSEHMDAGWGLQNRGRAEDRVFKQARFRRFGTKAQIQGDDRVAFKQAVDEEMDRMWVVFQKRSKIADRKTMERYLNLAEVFRTLFIQMEMKSSSLQIRGRVLEREYGR